MNVNIPDEEPTNVQGAYEQHVLIKATIKTLTDKDEKLKKIMREYADLIDANNGKQSIKVDFGGGKCYNKTRVVKKRELDYAYAKQLAEQKKLDKLFTINYILDDSMTDQIVTFLKEVEPKFIEEVEEVDEFQLENYIKEGKITGAEVQELIKETLEWRIVDEGTKKK